VDVTDMMSRRAAMKLGGAILALAALCGAKSPFARAQTKAASKLFHGVGVVTDLDAPSATVTIDAESIPGFMEAMEMPYRVRPASLVDGLRKGDRIEFTVEGGTYIIVAVKRIGS